MSDMASLKRLIKAMSREPNGQTRQDMLIGINAMLDMMDEPQVINAMSAPVINFFEGETLTYDDLPELEALKARKERADAKAVAKAALENIRIETDPDTGLQRITVRTPDPEVEAETIPTDDGPMGYAERNGLEVDRNGFFVKERKSRSKPKRKAPPASAENPNWGAFA